jgi:hypothetical protein
MLREWVTMNNEKDVKRSSHGICADGATKSRKTSRTAGPLAKICTKHSEQMKYVRM